MASSSLLFPTGRHGVGTHARPRQLWLLVGLSLGGLAAGGSVLILGNITVDLSSVVASFACFALLTVMVMLPLSLSSAGDGPHARFTVEPVVILNALYFIAAPLVSLLFSDYADFNQVPALNLWPVPLLILSVGFYLLYRGIRLSHHRLSIVRPGIPGRSRVLRVAFVLSLAALWVLRMMLLKRGLGITHGPSILEYDRNLGTWAVISRALAFVPLSLCLARICRSPGDSASEQVKLWRVVLTLVVASDSCYYLLIGSRLALLWELLVVVWAWWSRPGCIPRKYLIAGLIVMIMAIPAVYAQRLLLADLNLKANENQIRFIESMLPAAKDLRGGVVWTTMVEGLSGDAAYRLDGLNWFARVAHQHFEEHRELLLGSTWAYGVPFVVPHWLWPGKPVEEDSDEIIDEHFGLPPTDENTTTETEVFANFGVLGLWIWMLLYGALAGKLVTGLAAGPPLRESSLFLILCAMPVIFRMELDTMTMLADLRLPLVMWCLLRLGENQ